MAVDNSTKIAELQAILDSGVKRTSVDGTQVELDLDSIRDRIEELKREDDTNDYVSRPKTMIINMNRGL